MSLPFLTRLYGPEMFGAFALILALINILSVFITFKYEIELLTPKKDNEASDIFLLCLSLIFFSSVILFFIGWLFPWAYINNDSLSSIYELIKYLGFFAALTAVVTVTGWWLNRFKNYKAMAYLKVLQSAGFVLIAILFSNYRFDINVLIIAHIASVFFCMCISVYLIKDAFHLWDKRNILKTASKYINTPKFVLPSSMMDVISLQLPLIMIAILFSLEMSGQYSFAWRLSFIPMTTIGRAIGQIFWQRFSIIKENSIHAKNLLLKTWFYLFIAGLPMLAILFFGEELFILFLGNQWSEAGRIAEIIIPMAFLTFIASPTSALFVMLKKQKYVFVQGLCVLIFRPLALFLGYINDSLHFGIQLLAIFEIIYIITFMFVAYRLTSSKLSLN